MLRLIGHGGMGAVYEADGGSGARVAIKVVEGELAGEGQVSLRFAREARILAALESPHVVSILDTGTDAGRPYLVMELLHGEDLGQRLRTSRTLPLDETLRIASEVLEGLGAAHDAGVIHRDLKPDNVFLALEENVPGGPPRAKLVDFGMSKMDRPDAKTAPLALTRQGTVVGTPLYMAPEQARAARDVDARADLYSVGAIVFECLTGRPPHIGESYEQVILSICMQEPPDPRVIDPRIPPQVASFVLRALARDRSDRFPSARAMRTALDALRPGASRGAPAVAGRPGQGGFARGADPGAWRSGRPSLLVAGLVAAALGAAFSVAILLAFEDETAAPPARPAASAAPAQAEAGTAPRH